MIQLLQEEMKLNYIATSSRLVRTSENRALLLKCYVSSVHFRVNLA